MIPTTLARRYLVAATALILTTFTLHANVILPGATNVAPDVFPDPGNPPLLGDLTGTFSFGSGALTGSWEEVVAVDPFGVTCSGCLDFAFQVSVNPGLSNFISAMNLSRFFGYTTDVGYVVDSRDVAPNSVNRGPFGGGIGFNFNTLASVLTPGEQSDFLVVATNATTFDTNGSLGISGGNGTIGINGQINNLFEPTFVPEPSTVLLLSIGLAGIAAFRKRAS